MKVLALLALVGMAGCSSSTLGNGTSAPPKKNGEACSCGENTSGFVTCKSNSGPCEPELTCVDNKVCAAACKNGEPCEPGFTCADYLFNGASVGRYCLR